MSAAEQILARAQVLPEPAQKTILELVEKLASQNAGCELAETFHKRHVRLPLIDAKEPGVLNLVNAEIEVLLA